MGRCVLRLSRCATTSSREQAEWSNGTALAEQPLLDLLPNPVTVGSVRCLPVVILARHAT